MTDKSGRAQRSERFMTAFLSAVVAAALSSFIIQTVQVGAVFNDLHSVIDGVDTFLIFGFYSLWFTLGLGLVGWLILRVLHLSSVAAYAIMGAALGSLAAGVVVADGFSLQNPYLLSFSGAGLVAAVTFRWAYYRGEVAGSRGRSAA